MILTDSVQTVQLAAPGEEFTGECLETGWSLLTGTATGLSLLTGTATGWSLITGTATGLSPLTGTAGRTRGGVLRGVSRDRLVSTHRYSKWLVSTHRYRNRLVSNHRYSNWLVSTHR
jgi:hypothetical protein